MKLQDYVIVVLILMLAFSMIHQSNISAENHSFASVIPFDGPQGAVRFFDTTTGIMYTYDQALQKVIRIVQIEDLGDPAKEIVTPSDEVDLKYSTPRHE